MSLIVIPNFEQGRYQGIKVKVLDTLTSPLGRTIFPLRWKSTALGRVLSDASYYPLLMLPIRIQTLEDYKVLIRATIRR